jgi:hypothetical protein
MIMKLKDEARAHGGCRASEKKKVKMTLCLINYEPRHVDVWGSRDVIPIFFISELDGDEWSA